MNEDITISLPSLIHRIGRDAVKQAQGIAKQYDCELKRVRRSRNWCIVGGAIQIQSCTAHLQAEQLQQLKAEDGHCPQARYGLTATCGQARAVRR